MSKYRVALVEDNPDHALLIKTALQQVSVEVFHHSNGESALQWLQTTDALPQLILLDVKMPQMGGLQLLQAIRQLPACRILPIIMLTTSANPKDVETSYTNGANAYLTKPTGFAELQTKMQRTVAFWLECAEPPPQLPPQRQSA